jgi:hypothetical protein
MAVDVEERTALSDVTVGDRHKLAHSLTVKGAVPMFVFVCKDGEILNAKQFPIGSSYEWTLCKKGAPADPPKVVVADALKDTYGLRLYFTGATQYVLLVNEIDENGNRVRAIKDITYSSQFPADTYQEDLTVQWL